MLITNTNSNKISFGWKHSTHEFISEKVAEKINSSVSHKMRIDIETLKESCIAPDFARKKVIDFIHGHFADIDNPSLSPPDAYQLFLHYSRKAVNSNKEAQKNEREFYKRDKYLGYSLHFLQDMLNPFHVSYKPIPRDHPERIFHRKFECMAEKIQKKVLKQLISTEQNYEGLLYKSIIPEAMQKTKNSWKLIQSNGYKDMKKIAEFSLENTYKTTDLYLHKMFDIFKQQ